MLSSSCLNVETRNYFEQGQIRENWSFGVGSVAARLTFNSEEAETSTVLAFAQAVAFAIQTSSMVKAVLSETAFCG